MDEAHDAEVDTPSTGSPSRRVAWRRERGGASFVSPVVRRLLAEAGLEVGDLRGTGAGGRVSRTDVLAAVPAPTTADEVEPFTAIRRTTAARVARAKATAPHAHVAVACDYGVVDRVRREVGLTALPFVARAVIDALRAFPSCNATTDGERLVLHRAVHLGIAVDLAFDGLVVPVVHDADSMRLRALADAIADLAARARDRRLRPDDVVGGTFTITNPGPFGTFLSFPIVNQPQVAILATDAVRKRVVVGETRDGSDALTIRPTGMLSLSFDHRAVDVAGASAFVARVADILATRDWSTEV